MQRKNEAPDGGCSGLLQISDNRVRREGVGGLPAERNLQRYRRASFPMRVRVGGATTSFNPRDHRPEPQTLATPIRGDPFDV